MAIIAKMYIDDQVMNLIDFKMSFKQNTDYTGRPTTKPLLQIIDAVYETTKDVDIFAWSIHPTMLKKVIVEFSPSTMSSKTKRYEFYDVACTLYKEGFNGQNSNPALTTIGMSAAIFKYGNTIAEKSWKVSDIHNQVAPTVIQNDSEEEESKQIKFIAKLERKSDYKGEFGFDWMRTEYMPITKGGQGISENYEKFKKEYTPITIKGEEYFVPWLSMFPNQEHIQLKLTIDIKEGSPTDEDIIKLPSKDGIRFDPQEIKVSQSNGKEITVHCDNPLTTDVKIELLDKDDQIVGKINIFKNANHEQLHFEITPVRILRGISKESDTETIENKMDLGFGDKNKDINGDLQNLQKYLNTQSLNQALLKCKIDRVYDIIIDEQEWLDDDLIIEDQCVFKGNLLDKFNQEFEKQYPEVFKTRGITVYISPISHEKAGGYGNLGDVDAKGLVIFQSNLWSKTTFAHEIAHVAGLEHSFKEEDDLTDEELVLYNNRKKEIDSYFDRIIKSGQYSKNEIANLWNDYKDEMRSINSKLYTYNRNLYKFEQGKTDNFMDYHNTRQSFWKFQWKSLQEDVIKFYKKQ